MHGKTELKLNTTREYIPCPVDPKMTREPRLVWALQSQIVDLESELAEARRVIAWLRSPKWLKDLDGKLHPFMVNNNGMEWFIDMKRHLASSPPKGWKP
jgi:hypothetical protein